MTTIPSNFELLNEAARLGWRKVFDMEGRTIEGEASWRRMVEHSVPAYRLHMATQLRQAEEEIARAADAARRAMQAESDRDLPDPMAAIYEAQTREVLELAKFRATDGGRLERVIELLEELVARGSR